MFSWLRRSVLKCRLFCFDCITSNSCVLFTGAAIVAATILFVKYDTASRIDLSSRAEAMRQAIYQPDENFFRVDAVKGAQKMIDSAMSFLFQDGSTEITSDETEDFDTVTGSPGYTSTKKESTTKHVNTGKDSTKSYKSTVKMATSSDDDEKTILVDKSKQDVQIKFRKAPEKKLIKTTPKKETTPVDAKIKKETTKTAGPSQTPTAPVSTKSLPKSTITRDKKVTISVQNDETSIDTDALTEFSTHAKKESKVTVESKDDEEGRTATTLSLTEMKAETDKSKPALNAEKVTVKHVEETKALSTEPDSKTPAPPSSKSTIKLSQTEMKEKTEKSKPTLKQEKVTTEHVGETKALSTEPDSKTPAPPSSKSTTAEINVTKMINVSSVLSKFEQVKGKDTNSAETNNKNKEMLSQKKIQNSSETKTKEVKSEQRTSTNQRKVGDTLESLKDLSETENADLKNTRLKQENDDDDKRENTKSIRTERDVDDESTESCSTPKLASWEEFYHFLNITESCQLKIIFSEQETFLILSNGSSNEVSSKAPFHSHAVCMDDPYTLVSKQCTVLSLGPSHDVSKDVDDTSNGGDFFDEALFEFGCKIHAYDRMEHDNETRFSLPDFSVKDDDQSMEYKDVLAQFYIYNETIDLLRIKVDDTNIDELDELLSAEAAVLRSVKQVALEFILGSKDVEDREELWLAFHKLLCSSFTLVSYAKYPTSSASAATRGQEEIIMDPLDEANREARYYHHLLWVNKIWEDLR